MNLKERIVNNWKSSVLGLIVLIGGFVLVGLDKITLTEFLPFLVGLYGLVAKDKKESK